MIATLRTLAPCPFLSFFSSTLCLLSLSLPAGLCPLFLPHTPVDVNSAFNLLANFYRDFAAMDAQIQVKGE
jgi:hypothetical protein